MSLQLPQPESLIVEETKVRQYLLNLEHPVGGSKARFFLNRGFQALDWQAMAEALKQHGATQPVVETG